MVSVCTDDQAVTADLRRRGLWRDFRKAIAERPRANCAVLAHTGPGAITGFVYFAGPPDTGFASITGDPAHVMNMVGLALAGSDRRTLH